MKLKEYFNHWIKRSNEQEKVEDLTGKRNPKLNIVKNHSSLKPYGVQTFPSIAKSKNDEVPVLKSTTTNTVDISEALNDLTISFSTEEIKDYAKCISKIISSIKSVYEKNITIFNTGKHKKYENLDYQPSIKISSLMYNELFKKNNRADQVSLEILEEISYWYKNKFQMRNDYKFVINIQSEKAEENYIISNIANLVVYRTNELNKISEFDDIKPIVLNSFVIGRSLEECCNNPVESDRLNFEKFIDGKHYIEVAHEDLGRIHFEGNLMSDKFMIKYVNNPKYYDVYFVGKTPMEYQREFEVEYKTEILYSAKIDDIPILKLIIVKAL